MLARRTPFLLKVENKKMRFRFDIGGGIGTVTASSVDVTNGEWHNVVVVRRGNVATLTVDDSDPVEGSSDLTRQQLRLSTESRLYLGGEADGFVGCIQDFRFNEIEMPCQSDGDFRVASVGDEPLSGCQSANVCSPNPCPSTQRCVDQWNQHECTLLDCAEVVCMNNGTCNYGTCGCSSEFTGYACETDIDECAVSSPPCMSADVCVNLHGGYDCVSNFAFIKTDDNAELIGGIVFAVVIILLVVLLVVYRFVIYRKKGSGDFHGNGAVDASNDMFRMTDISRRDYREFEATIPVQMTASMDFEGAGEEDFGRRSNPSTMHRYSSRDSLVKAPVPTDEMEPVSTAAVIANGRALAVAASPPERADDDDDDRSFLHVDGGALDSEHSDGSVVELPREPEVPAEVDVYMERKLADTQAEDNRRLIPDEVICFDDEGEVSDGPSLSSLSGISESSETSAEFWERVREWGSPFDRLADVVTEGSNV